jgi:hypothetical protein
LVLPKAESQGKFDAIESPDQFSSFVLDVNVVGNSIGWTAAGRMPAKSGTADAKSGRAGVNTSAGSGGGGALTNLHPSAPA